MLMLQDKSFSSEDSAIGNTIGYGVHADYTKAALRRAGVVFSDEAKVVLHQGPAHMAKPIEGKINILYTAWETPDVPEMMIEVAQRMNMVIGVSEFVTNAFKRSMKKNRTQHETVNLGVDINIFDYVKRKKDKPFRFLWIGSNDPRKGWDLIRKAWYPFAVRDDCFLIMKTTGRNLIERSGNVIIDSRKISREDLARLYHISHCFIFPSYGEGFGLPLAEAMSTGMPCIYVPWGGVCDYANSSNAYPVKYNVVEVNYGCKTTGAMAVISSLQDRMKLVMENYKAAVNRGKQARRFVERNLTWDDTGRKMKEIIERYISHGTISSK